MNKNYSKLKNWISSNFFGRNLSIMDQAYKFRVILKGIVEFSWEELIVIHKIEISEIADNEFLIKLNNEFEMTFMPMKEKEAQNG